jgi:hypothetical protein
MTVRIAFVEDALSARTGASRFVREIAASLGPTTVLVAGAGAPPRAEDAVAEAFVAGAHDLWIFFGTDDVALRLVPLGLRGAVVIPLLERVHGAPDAHFQALVLSRFAAFSRALHDRLQALRCRSAVFRYAPPPGPSVERPQRRGEWAAFFPEATPHEVPNAPSVIAQCRVLGIARLHVHRPGEDPAGALDAAALVRLGRIDGVAVTTSGSADTSAAAAAARSAHVVFAPRLHDGLGHEITEAMAAGKVVVAPDRPAANELLVHLESGILYDPRRPEALPPLSAQRLLALSAGATARVAATHAAWAADVDRFVSLLLDDGRRWAASDSSASFANAVAKRAHERRISAGRK